METLDDPVESLAAELAGVTDRSARERIFLKHTEQFGVSRFAYVSASPRLGPFYVETNYPTEWVEHYVAQNYVEVDVVPLESRRSPVPFQWREALARPPYGAEAQHVFHEAAAFGIRDGFSVPIHGAGGFALISMAVEDASLFTPAGRPRQHALQLIGLYFHLACERSLAEAAAPRIHLTARESEVLHWAAKGKTGWEIAHILHLSERTVTFHVENAKAKLGAATRSHAVVKAIFLGLICP